ncbi:hypothetical protein [Magnetococcus sp. PR-3]|uniref:hypothetical protein n=1 Tax=Magnetococcus sp. PR-3 TaxID=3120355 RepID=UPI002FCE183B
MDGYAVIHEGHRVLGAGQTQDEALAMARTQTDEPLGDHLKHRTFEAVYDEFYLLPATEGLMKAVIEHKEPKHFKVRQFGLGWIVDLPGAKEDHDEEE